ncbi:MAG: dihydroorotate dehydrogenase electron transfer subunit [Porphyromonas sp.]|nr:dihydroorotate dehydrogenase electron transfer subunit [Porphyromonas sp.]
MAKSIFDVTLKLVHKEIYSDSLFKGRFAPVIEGTVLPAFEPGQFVQVWIKDCDGVMLRRPISIYDMQSDYIDLLIQKAGRGTAAMFDAPIGSRYNVLLPLGNSFRLPDTDAHPLLVGGGVGIAPLYALGKKLNANGISPTFLFGARSAGHFPDLAPFKSLGTLFTTTEDGSEGEKGLVTRHSVLQANQFTHIYTCGPTPMMKAVAAWARERHIPAQASLENMMACGMGVCLCCVEPTVAGHKTVCHDGPVFDTAELLWE